MYAVAGNTTFIALLAMQGESMVIDLREEPDVEGGQNINPLGAALWTCMDGLYAATEPKATLPERLRIRAACKQERREMW